MKNLKKIIKKLILVVMDGWGIAPSSPGNYITQAKTKNFNYFIKNFPNTINKAAEKAVGLPLGTQGNSEVGHLHIGAGRIILQMYEKINEAIKNKSFFENKTLVKAINFAKESDSSLHLVGLCSDGGVHSHLNHLFALLQMAKRRKVKKVFIHFIADGRDVPEKSAQKYIKIIEEKIKKIGVGKIATVIGRYYAMDRDNNQNRIKKAYDLIMFSKGFKVKSASEAINLAYKRGDKTDYYIKPTLINNKEKKPIAFIEKNDSLIFFNFRTDRLRQLVNKFLIKASEFNLLIATLTEYKKTFTCHFGFKEDVIKNNLGQILENYKLKQLRIAETEKYAHVTYFFNSQIEDFFKNEERILIPSSKVSSYDKKPEMSAYEITDKLIKEIKKNKFDFILANLANCDLVGHSGIKKAIIKAVEVVDECVGKIIKFALDSNYTIILTADHGSAEDKLYPNGEIKPAHSINPVPFIVISNDEKLKKIKLVKGEQKDVAPTILDIMNIKKPKEMTGKSLIVKK